MTEICPLVFEPIFREKVWGGRNLARLLDKTLPPEVAIGESWDCADLENGQSVVARGPATGLTLHQLMEEWGEGLLGRVKPVDGRFPLLIKFLDACENLSVQVHPGEPTGQNAGGHGAIKHEAWHILWAEPSGCIYRGFRPGVDVGELRDVKRENPAMILDFLQRIPVRAGQTYFLPGGTPHAIGAGVVLAEVQTPSDVTYRLYDWDRKRPASDSGLHVEEGLASIRDDVDFSAFEKRTHVTSLFATITRLVKSPSFNMEKVRFIGELEQEIPYVDMVCWIVLDGRGEISYGGGDRLGFAKGDVVIVPAGLRNGRVLTLTDCTWLEVSVPVDAEFSRNPLREAGVGPTFVEDKAKGLVPLNISIGRGSEENRDE
ncbi:MAG TPA: type I phosphomannose isomerase catalytic subunit [Phycisphaerae bacterium]|nr:type I phosphomannose isomerase catalytic subunit [Phycisphaerae bacterium]